MKKIPQTPSITEKQIERIQTMIMNRPEIIKAMLISADGLLILPRIEGSREESFAAIMAMQIAAAKEAYKYLKMAIPECVIISGKEPAVVCNAGDENVLVVLTEDYPNAKDIQKILALAKAIDVILASKS